MTCPSGRIGSTLRWVSQFANAVFLGTWMVWIAASTFGWSQGHTVSNFAQLSRQADQAREAHDFNRAVKLYRQALAQHPRWAQGWWSLGTIYYDVNSYQNAAHAFQRLTVIEPKNGTSFAMLGLSLFELSQDDQALQDIQAARKLGIQTNEELHRVVLYHEGLLFLRKNKFRSAQEALTLLASEGATENSAALALGMSVLLVHPSKLPPEGSLGYGTILRIGEAETLSAEKKFEEGKHIYASAVEETPSFPNLHYAYGRFLVKIDESDQAITEFEEEIQNNPSHVQARLEIAAGRYRIDSAAGVKYAEEAVRLDPQLPFGHYLLGLLYLDTADTMKAIRELEVAQRGYSKESKIYFALGNAYAQAGRKQDAARARAMFLRRTAENKETSEPSTSEDESPSLDQRSVRAGPKSKPQ